MQNGYSICFNRWALDKEIKNELNLLLIISSLCAREGYCYASNKYLAELFNITEISISNKIKKLEKENYIEIEYEKRGCEVISRKIRLKNILIDDYKKFIPTIKKNFKGNNISSNNTSNNNIYSAVIDFLNEKTGQHYKSSTPKTRNLINARVNEGFILEDFKKVIKKKTDEWKNTKMEMYLRPETLFGTKFESYLNQKSNDLPEWFYEDFDKEENNADKQYMDELLKDYK